MPKIFSIVIPSYNSKTTLIKLLESLMEQIDDDWEIIVVDDGSTDDTLREISKLPVKIIVNSSNLGPATARNLGVDKAVGDIILFMDSDVIPKQGTLAHVKTRFMTDKNLSALVGIYSKDPVTQGCFQNYKALLSYFWMKDAGEIYSLDSCCSAIKKDIFIKAGKFNTRFKGADIEDFELGRRVSEICPIFLDKDFQFLHNFPCFLGNMKKFYRRTYMWVFMFLEKKEFDKAVTTLKEGLACFTGFLLFLSPLCLAFVNFKTFIGVFLVFLFLFFMLNMRFFWFLFREKGVVFTFRCIIIHLLNSLVISTAAIHAFAGAAAGKRMQSIWNAGSEA